MGHLFLILIILLGSLLRFYNLSWGDSFFFHPDERNIASSVSQLQFPNQLNPHFFAYGSFPIYIIYFTGIVLNFVFRQATIPSVSFEQAVLISRFYSAVFSIFITIIIYFLVKKLRGEKAALLASFLSAVSTGLVQFAHFGTFEMWLTFFGLLLFYLCLRTMENGQLRFTIWAGVISALLISTKISSLVLLPIPILIFFFKTKKVFLNILTFTVITLLIFLITSPFVILDFSSFMAGINYESGVALGTLPVFYTGQFFDAMPVLFQFSKIYPFLLNPLITIIFIPSLLYVVYLGFKKKNVFHLLLAAFYLTLFFSQSFLFAKWTRYMIPTLPFMYLTITVALADYLEFWSSIKHVALSIILVISALFIISYFMTAYAKPDARIAASLWAKNNIPKDSKILSEVYDLGITPFNEYFPNITLFNFYGLDNNSVIDNDSRLFSLLLQTDYIILPSQRLMKTRRANKRRFPNGYKFYQTLLNGELGFEKAYQSPCDFYCRITYLGEPIFNIEETVSVFDRPTVFIFKKK